MHEISPTIVAPRGRFELPKILKSRDGPRDLNLHHLIQYPSYNKDIEVLSSRALPGYEQNASVVAVDDLGRSLADRHSCLTETVENRLWQLRIDYITTVGGSDHATMA